MAGSGRDRWRPRGVRHGVTGWMQVFRKRRPIIVGAVACVSLAAAAVAVPLVAGGGAAVTGAPSRTDVATATGVGTAASNSRGVGAGQAGATGASGSTAGATNATTSSTLVKVASKAIIPSGATPVGALPSSTVLHMDVVLRPRNQAALDTFISSVSDPSSPQYGHYLAKGEFASRFGPSPATVAAVRGSLTAAGLTVGTPSPGGLLLPASGTAAQVAAGLHVALEQFRLTSGRTAFANTTAARLPATAAAGVTGVTGLADLVKETPLLARGASPSTSATTTASVTPSATAAATVPKACTTAKDVSSTAHTWTQLAQTYGFSTAYADGDLGQGMKIGLFELAKYPTGDTATFENCFKLATGGSYGTVTPMPVDGGPGTTTSGAVEVLLDIQDVLGLAPKATVLVYDAPNTNTGLGLLAEYTTMVTTDMVQVISTSWGGCELLNTPNVAAAENGFFEQAATQGQSVFAAAGDTGSEDCYRTSGHVTKKLAVDDPASQPFVTGVGGTSLTSAAANAPVETVWKDGGGGVSARWAKPPWQTTGRSTIPKPRTTDTLCTTTPRPGAGTTSSCRQVPDVSASADPTHGDVIYCKGAPTTGGFCSRGSGWTVIGGTSAAAPLWGAFTALADDSCSTSVGFLNPKLYLLGDRTTHASGKVFNDITSGTNDNGTSAHLGFYAAASGYDNASGWGTPQGANLLSSLCPSKALTPSIALSTSAVGAAGTSYTVQFTTSSSGSLVPGDTIDLAAPVGTTFPAATADYSITGPAGVTIAGVATAPDTPSAKRNIATITIGGTPVPASTIVTLVVHTVSNATTAGAMHLGIRTTTDAAGATASYTLEAGPPSASRSALAASAATATVGSGITVTGSVRDQYGNSLSGQVVKLSASASGTPGTITTQPPPASKATNSTGEALFTISDSATGTVTYAATVTSGSVPVGQPVHVKYQSHVSGVTATPSTHVAGNTATYTVGFTTSAADSDPTSITLTGPSGTGWPTAASDYALSPATVGTATPAPTITGSQVTIHLAGSAASGGTEVSLAITHVTNPTHASTSDTLSVKTSGDTISASSGAYAIVAGPPASPPSSVVASASSATTGSPITVTVTDEDRFSNPEKGDAVALTASAGSHATVTPASRTTSTTGRVTFTVNDSTAESLTLSATDGTVTLGTVTVTFSAPPPPPPSTASGYDLVGADGGVFVFAPPGTTTGYYGSLPGLHVVPAKPIVGMVPTVTDKGYFLVGGDGGVFAFGTAPYLGSLPGLHVTPALPITGIVAANTDKGYFLVGADGGVFAFGTVPYLGSLPGSHISVDNIIGIAATPNGTGYWLVSATGTVYAFGKAQKLGTAHGTPSPVSAIAGTPTGGGYWITTKSGAVYHFGNAKAHGTLPALGVTPALPVIGIVHTAGTNGTGGYWLIGGDGGIFAFGTAPYVGSLPGLTVHVTNIVGAVPIG